MSSPDLTSHELSCPNCGAPYALPAFGHEVECQYCGTRFVLPEAVRPKTESVETFDAPDISVDLTGIQTNTMRWVKWLVIFIVIVTVVPTLCGVLASFCGVFGAFVPFFAR